MISDDVADWL